MDTFSLPAAPVLKLDTFSKDFNQKLMVLGSPTAHDRARRSRAMIFQAKAAPASHQPPPPQGECQRRSSAFPLVVLWSWQWGVQNSSVGQTREHQSCLSSQLRHSRHQKEGRNKERQKNKTKKEKKGEKEVSNSIYTNSRSTAPRLLLVIYYDIIKYWIRLYDIR